MLKRTITILFLFIFSTLKASHIVGGEFELLHISGNLYQLNAIIYFDVVNGNPGAIDQFITARIFQKKNNIPLRLVTIPLISRTRVDYFQPDCSTGEVVTDRIYYSTQINLNESIYNHQKGYYIAWERCCRNYTIDNIKSVNVTAFPGTPDYAGQTFYLEFPPVVDKNGEPFINSSPQLFPPLNDYACPFRPYWVDFAGTDVDDDSLVYTLVTPLNTWAAAAVVTDPSGAQIGANPGPYPEVKWEDGYGLDNILGGNPDLAISTNGFLTVTPQNEGLYVFAVKCEEFRDGKKIGEVRRDFQMLVVDQCPVADPPKIRAKRLTDGSYTDAESMQVFFSSSTSDSDRCINVKVTDLDSNKPNTNPSDNYREEVYIKAVPLNFEEDAGVVLPDKIEAILENGGAAIFDICFPECPFIDPEESDYFELAIVAFDDACALPLTDSVYVQVYIEPPVNSSPYYANTKGGTKYNTIIRRVEPTANGSVSINLNAWDNENQNLIMDIYPDEFDLENAGMSFSDITHTPGNAQTLFTWNIDCNDDTVDFNEGKDISTPDLISRQYDIMVIIEDEDDCDFERTDTLMINLIIDFPGQTKPIIFKQDQPTKDSLRIEAGLYDEINFDVFGQDTDNDQIKITAEGSNFDFEYYGVNFSDKQGAGNPGISSQFNWDLSCEKFNLAVQDSFRIYFYVEDFDDCELQNQDTLLIDFIIKDIPNLKPEISFNSLNELQIVDNTITAIMTDQIEVEILGRDYDPDSVTLSLLGIRGTQDVRDFEFETTKGLSITKSELIWELNCQYLANDYSEGNYDFIFTVTDNHCPLNDGDTLALQINISDLDIGEIKFEPPNLFTPNGDDKNEYFELEGVDVFTNEFIDTGLPINNCKGQFERVTIINRWGREVFQSNQRDFKWSGDNEPAGVYFYNIIYTDKEFKGSITLLK